MSTLRSTLSALFLSCLAPFAAAQYIQAWSAYRDMHRYGNEQALSVSLAPDGGYYMASVDKTDALLRKVDSSGALLWSHIIPGVNDRPSEPILLTNGTGVLLVAGVQSENVGSIMATKYDTDGHLLWTNHFAKSVDVGTTDAVFDPSGNVVVSAIAGVNGRGEDGVVLKLNITTGAQMFRDSYGTASTNDRIRNVRTDSAGNIYAVGWTRDSQVSGPPTIQYMKYSPTGALLWTKNFGSSDSDNVAVDGAGNSYLTLNDQTTFTTTAITKLDTNGNILWTKAVGSWIPGAYSAFAANGNLVLAWSDNAQIIHVMQVTPIGGMIAVGSTAGHITAGHNNLVVNAAGDVYVGGNHAPTTNFGVAQLFKFNLSTGFLWSGQEAGSFGSNNLGENPSGVVIDGLGRAIYASTVSNVAPTLLDTRISAYDSAGNRLWGSDYDPITTADNAAGSVSDAAGNTYVVNYDFGGTRLTRFDTNGHFIWMHTVTTVAADGNALPPQMSINGDVVVAARKIGSGGGETGNLEFFDPAGILLWHYSLSSSTDVLRDYQVANDGTVYLCFEHFASNVGNVRLVRLSTAGAVLWTVNDVAAPQEHVFHLSVDGNGAAFVTYGAQEANLTLAKFSSAGAVLWRKDLAGIAFETCGPTRLDGSGNLLVLAGGLDSASGSVAAGVDKVDTNGNILWTTPLNIVTATNPQTSLVVDKFGNTFVGGWSPNKLRVQKISASGLVAWTTDYTTSFVGMFPTLLPDQAGGVFVLTSTPTANGLDYCLVKFASDGTFPWPASGGIFVNGSIRYDSKHLDDVAVALTADALGNLYVTGTSYGPSNTQDVNVVKYAVQTP